MKAWQHSFFNLSHLHLKGHSVINRLNSKRKILVILHLLTILQNILANFYHHISTFKWFCVQYTSLTVKSLKLTSVTSLIIFIIILGKTFWSFVSPILNNISICFQTYENNLSSSGNPYVGRSFKELKRHLLQNNTIF